MSEIQGPILVTGATGKQGGAVARHLLARGHQVVAMTRKPESDAARHLAGLGARVVPGNLDDEGSLERALSGTWGTFAVQNTWEAGVAREEEQGKRFAAVARRAGLQHYVYTSVASAHRATGIPHFDNKFRVEEKVRSLGFPTFAIIRPVFFMENWVSPWFKPALDQGRLMVPVQAGTKLQQIASDDIGAFAALAFEQVSRFNGRAIDIAGDEKSMPETAAILGRAMGRTVSFEPVPIEEARKGSAEAAAMYEWFDRVGYDADIAGVKREFGITFQTLEEWASRALTPAAV
jgi:uncharacterized protein YbjT (DUF2867 family)